VQGRYLYRSCAFFCIYVYQGGFNGSVVAQIGNRNDSDVINMMKAIMDL